MQYHSIFLYGTTWQSHKSTPPNHTPIENLPVLVDICSDVVRTFCSDLRPSCFWNHIVSVTCDVLTGCAKKNACKIHNVIICVWQNIWSSIFLGMIYTSLVYQLSTKYLPRSVLSLNYGIIRKKCIFRVAHGWVILTSIKDTRLV